MKWKYLKEKWTALQKTEWITNAKKAFNELLRQYQFYKTLDDGDEKPIIHHSLPKSSRKRSAAAAFYSVDEDSDSELQRLSINDQLVEYLAEPRKQSGLRIEDSPV